MSTGNGPSLEAAKWLRWTSLFFCSTIILLLAGCSKPEKPHIVVAESYLSASDTLAFIAANKGYWKDEGLDVQVLSFTAGKPAFDAMLSGQAQFAFAGETPAALAAYSQKSYGVLAEVATSSRELALVARRDEQISTVADLRDKKVGIMKGTQSDYFLYRSLLVSRITPDSVHTISMQPPEMPRAITSHDVDAISIWQPHSSRALSQLGQAGISLKTDEKYEGIVSLMSLRSYVSQNPEIVRRFLRGLIKAEAFVKAHPTEAQAMVAQQIKLAPSILTTFYSDYDFHVKLSPILLSELVDEGQWAKATGIVGSDRPLPQYRDYILSQPLRSLSPDRVADSVTGDNQK